MILPSAFLVTLAALFGFIRLRGKLLLAAHVFGHVECIAEPSVAAITEYLLTPPSSTAAGGVKRERRKRVSGGAAASKTMSSSPPTSSTTSAAGSTAAQRATVCADGALQVGAFPARTFFERQRARRTQFERGASGTGGATPPSAAALLQQRRAQQAHSLEALPYQYELELQCALLVQIALLLVATVALGRFARAADAVQYAALTLCIVFAFVNVEMLRDVGWSSNKSRASMAVAFVGFVLATSAAVDADGVVGEGSGGKMRGRAVRHAMWQFVWVADAQERAAARLARLLGHSAAGMRGALRLLTAVMAALLGASAFIPAVRRAQYLMASREHGDDTASPSSPSSMTGAVWRRRARSVAVYLDLLGGAPIVLLWLRPLHHVPPVARALACAAYATLRLGVLRVYLQTHMHWPLQILRALRRARRGRHRRCGSVAAAPPTPAASARAHRVAERTLAQIRGVRTYMCSAAIQYGGVPATLFACAAMLIAACAASCPPTTVAPRWLPSTLGAMHQHASAPGTHDSDLAVRVLGGMGDVWMWWLLTADSAIVLGTCAYVYAHGALRTAMRRAGVAGLVAVATTATTATTTW